MEQNIDTLPKAGQHVIATRGTSRLEGTVTNAERRHPLITVSLPNTDGPMTTDFDLWDKDGWTFEVTEGVLA